PSTEPPSSPPSRTDHWPPRSSIPRSPGTPGCTCSRTGCVPLARRADGGSGVPVSFATLALWVAGAGVAGVALTAVAVRALPLPPAGRAVVAGGGIVGTVVAMGAASRDITARAVPAEDGDDDGDGAGPADPATPDTAPPAESGGQPPRPDGLG